MEAFSGSQPNSTGLRNGLYDIRGAFKKFRNSTI